MENRKVDRSRLVVKKETGEAPTAPAPAPAPPDNDQEKVLLIFGARVSVHAQNQGGGERQVPVAAGMGNRNVERSRVVVKEKDEAPPAPAPPGHDQEKYRSILQEKLYRTRLELQKMLALSADADEILSRLTAEAHKVKQEKEEEYMKHKALQVELHARRNAQAMMTPPTYGSPAAAFAGRSCYGNSAPFRRMTTQEQYYARAAGVCFASSPPPRMFDSFLPTAATGIMPGTAGKKRSANEFDLVAQEMLRLSRKKEEVVKAPIHEEDNDAVSGTTSSEETVSDVGLIEVGGGECSLADSAASKKQ